MQTREHTLNCWLKNVFPHDTFTLTPLSGDASFRRYFRLHVGDQYYVVMDAPPEKEPLDDYLSVRALLQEAKICVPHCFAEEKQQGFLLLTDFGDDLLLHSLTPDNTHAYYEMALRIIIQLQNIPKDHYFSCPAFDETHIHQELRLFNDWFVQQYLKLPLTDAEQALIQNTFSFLANALTQLPQVLIHRDYHSRNIMCLASGQLGLIDFQDAMIGPWTYDLVSLLKDCYIQWPQDHIHRWLSYFYQHAALSAQQSEEDFLQGFELSGLQRHLKVLGIFSRLALRDGKTQFLNDLPLTLQYVLNALKHQPQLHDFYDFMQHKIVPAFEAASLSKETNT